MKNKKFTITHRQEGAGLIEVLFAVVIAGTVLTAVAISLVRSIYNTAEARYREVATSRSQEVIEYLRKHKFVDGWIPFSSYVFDPDGSKVYCLDIDIELNSYEVGTDWLPDDVTSATECSYVLDVDSKGEFRRVLTVQSAPDVVTTIVETSWRVGETERSSVPLVQEFTRYQ